MIDMEHYIQKGIEFEAAFHYRIDKGDRPPPLKAQSGVITLSAFPLFSDGENITVKLHQTQALGLPKAPPSVFLHRHDFFEFNYIYRGQVEHILSNGSVHQDAGQLLLMNPLAIHDPKPLTEDTVLFNILLDRNYGETVLSSLLSYHKKYFHFFMDQLYGAEHMQSYLLFDCTPEISQLMQSIIQEYYNQKPCYQQMLLAYLMQFFVLCSRQSYQEHRAQEEELLQHKLSSDILTYLQTHYATATLTDTAAHFSYSVSYLSRMIKQETGHNFSEILQKLKLQSACNFLKNSNLSMDIITEHIGYKDPSHFTKIFTKIYGMTPSQYRKTHQQNATP